MSDVTDDPATPAREETLRAALRDAFASSVGVEDPDFGAAGDPEYVIAWLAKRLAASVPPRPDDALREALEPYRDSPYDLVSDEDHRAVWDLIPRILAATPAAAVREAEPGMWRDMVETALLYPGYGHRPNNDAEAREWVDKACRESAAAVREAELHETHVCRDCGAAITLPYAPSSATPARSCPRS